MINCFRCDKDLKLQSIILDGIIENYYYSCINHCLLLLDEGNNCFRYDFLIANQFSLIGIKDFHTIIYDKSGDYKFPWIPIKLDNLSISIPKLTEKLLKLKTFA